MNSIHHPKLSLILKNGTWVPRHERRASIVNEHGLTLKKTLGEGSYAKVKLADSLKHNKEVAVKTLDKRRLPKLYLEKCVPREIKVMSILNHPNIVSIHDVFETPFKIFIVMEYAPGGDLLHYINNRTYETEDQVKRHFKQLISAVSSCHQQFITHRDLKLENILIDKNNNIKLTDFGFARLSNKSMMLETACGSLLYASPEVIRGDHYNGFASDCWSLGIILYAMLCARLPYQRKDILALANCENVKPMQFHEEVSQEAKNVVHCLLVPEPENRLTCESMLQMEWCKPEKCGVSESLDHSFEMISAVNTIACNHGDDINILTKVVRSNFGNTFAKAISRQKVNLHAMAVFKELRQTVTQKRSAATAGYYHPIQNKRKTSLVTEILNCEHHIVTERRKTLADEKTLKDEIRRKSLVKDVKITRSKHSNGHRNHVMFSKMFSKGYTEFLTKQNDERMKELSHLWRCSSSRIAGIAQKQKTATRAHVQVDIWFEAESNENDENIVWTRKCSMSCNRSAI